MLTRNSVITLSAAMFLTALAFQAPAKVSAEEATASAPAQDQAVKEKKSAHSRKAIAAKAPAEASESAKTKEGYVPYSDSSSFIMGD